MTPQDHFLVMLAKHNVRHWVNTDEDGYPITHDWNDGEVTIVHVKNSPSGTGYHGFYSRWHFDAQGVLLRVAHWE